MVVETREMITQVICQEKIPYDNTPQTDGKLLKLKTKGSPFSPNRTTRGPANCQSAGPLPGPPRILLKQEPAETSQLTNT